MKKNKLIFLIVNFFCLSGLYLSCTSIPKDASINFPNILWIVSEDNSPFLGCYGDTLASTPNLDQLASEGLLYTHAFANAPVCAPARNTIITGVYACSNGNQHMRSYYPLSDQVKMFPFYLRKAGYYCTNNSKEDYNTIKPDGVWDESSRKAHYSNRKPGQAFFHIQNTNLSHESSIHKTISPDSLKHLPSEMNLPPYHPDTKEMRHDWAHYYDNISKMDSFVGTILQDLNKAGLEDSTIVFYYSDHGGILGRSKRYIYESGTKIPFIVRIPDQYNYLFPDKKAGNKSKRLISFVDLAPTMLSIAGIPIPDYMQGKAFLGDQKTKNPRHVHMFRDRMDEWYDMSRSVRNEKYRYIKNFMPYRIYGQRVDYLWRAKSMQSWEQAFLDGQCNETQSIFWNSKSHEELYDTENDPWEVNNLANNPEFENILTELRKVNENWMLQIKDAGLIPEAEIIRQSGQIPIYDYIRNEKISMNELLEAASIASTGATESLDRLIEFTRDKDAAVRYWGATGLLILKEEAEPAKHELINLLNDESPNVRIVASEALYKLGEKDASVSTLVEILSIPEDKARCHALNTIKYIKDERKELKDAILSISGDTQYQYSYRLVKWFLEKWKLEPIPNNS